ncbi:MAG: butyrate kinase [Clostridiales bacterium]|nr:butyrate kinase [Clostridiales bacterium]
MDANSVYKILVLNPGSTSTKLGLYENDKMINEKVIRHNRKELLEYETLLEQKPLREKCVYDFLKEIDVSFDELDTVVSRGGLIRPIESGTYTINSLMYNDLKGSVATLHASALGGVIAYEIAKKENIPCYVVDPVVVDELDTRARLTGMPGIERKSAFHALNQKAVARKYSNDIGTIYENGRYIVAHMGGGISIGAHRYGRVVDVNDALCGEGPFSPERTGTLPLMGLIRMCYSGNYSEKEVIELVTKNGGMIAYLGTNNLKECERMIMEGDEFAALVLETMAYQVSKDIGAMIAVLEGRVDAILLTGGLAYSNRFTSEIKHRLDMIAPVVTYPGEMEMEALAEGAYRVLSGTELVKDYE